MKKKNLIPIWILLLQQVFSYGQYSVSVYELGDSVVSCETNFENLIRNWTSNNINNAREYKFFGYSFVETITDSAKYNYYRNYFSGIEPVYGASSGDMKTDTHEHRTSEYYIWPGFIHNEFYDTRGFSERVKMLFPDDFNQKAKEILTREFNIDTMMLNYYTYEYNRRDTIIGSDGYFKSYGTSHRHSYQVAASPDSISKNYIDVFIKGNKKIEEFSTEEIRRLTLEQLLIEKMNRHISFNEQVRIGDKVYVIRFEHRGKQYHNYVVCSAETKKVVMDYFFIAVVVYPEKNNSRLIVE